MSAQYLLLPASDWRPGDVVLTPQRTPLLLVLAGPRLYRAKDGRVYRYLYHQWTTGRELGPVTWYLIDYAPWLVQDAEGLRYYPIQRPAFFDLTPILPSIRQFVQYEGKRARREDQVFDWVESWKQRFDRTGADYH